MQADHHRERPSGAKEQLLRVKEVAERLGCSHNNVYALINRGFLPVVRIGRSKGYRVDSRDLDEFLQRRKVQYESAEPDSARPQLRHLKL